MIEKWFRTLVVSFLMITMMSCEQKKEENPELLFKTYCASCHILPEIQDLPKSIWASEILPEMGARLGIRDSAYNPLRGYPFSEMEAITKSGIYPYNSSISREDWEALKKYVLDLAPDSLYDNTTKEPFKTLENFDAKTVSIDTENGSFITHLNYNFEKNWIEIGDAYGILKMYDPIQKTVYQEDQFSSSVLAHSTIGKTSITTLIGKLDPSQIASGRIWINDSLHKYQLPDTLHRPVNNLVKDLNNDGNLEMVVSEFGNFTGSLSLFAKQNTGYTKTNLLNLPGVIRVLSHDMDKNGLEDLVVLTSQGDESITILYQEENLRFKIDKAIRFSPVYGSSWFELVDYDKDEDLDIITVHGDNADKSYVHKPYHGMRIHLNDGKNKFSERYFYPLHGATRVLTRDFDKDGDLDIALIATFPDYENNPDATFVYLENEKSEDFKFVARTFDKVKSSRWFLMDAGDIDQDGDEDIILSAFTYLFTPVPDKISKQWNMENIDLMILENKLK